MNGGGEVIGSIKQTKLLTGLLVDKRILSSFLLVAIFGAHKSHGDKLTMNNSVTVVSPRI